MLIMGKVYIYWYMELLPGPYVGPLNQGSTVGMLN
jgi:hypothetical protein